MSWVNADEAQGRKSFADYMREGFLKAVDAVQKATGFARSTPSGSALAAHWWPPALAYMAAKNDNRVNAATFFTTQVDFEKAGDLMVYVDDEQVKWIEERMKDKGYLPGTRMADAFNLLRSNDLIWSYVVNNYLLGKDPAPFDLLYWNSDSTRMPAGVHSFYLRECYLHNKLSQGKMVLDNVRIDLKKVKIPVYNLAAREDHIAPLPSVFRLGQFLAATPRWWCQARAILQAWSIHQQRRSINIGPITTRPPRLNNGWRRQGTSRVLVASLAGMDHITRRRQDCSTHAGRSRTQGVVRCTGNLCACQRRELSYWASTSPWMT